MIIPTRKPGKVFADDPKVDRKKEAEAFLTDLAECNPNYDEPEPNADAYRGLHQTLCGLILWVTVVGTSILAVGGFYYLTIPTPSAYVTTQNGGLFLLHPISVQK